MIVDSAAKFAECEQLLTSLLAHSELDGNITIAMRTTRILNYLALGRTTRVPEQIELLISEVESQPADFQLHWWFDGTRHFISQRKNLSNRQKWFSLLFTALGRNDRFSIAQGLSQVKANYKQ
jgi:hypothetical protein